MSDENGMETTRADSPSVEESIFGNGAGDATATVPVEEGDNEETTQDGHDAGDEAAQQAAAEKVAGEKAPQQKNESGGAGEPADDEGKAVADDTVSTEDDLKVVVSIKGDRATIGVQKPSADPYIETFDDQDLSRLAQKVAEVNERAQARWEEGPKHPAYRRPVPAPTRRNRSPQAATNLEGESQPQPMTLRLF